MNNRVQVVKERRHRWLPSLSIAIWLVFFLGLSLSDWRLVLISADGDPCLHWRIGKWMLEHHEVIRIDVFSHTRSGAQLISKEWLSELVFTLVGNFLGWNGIVLLSAALIATTLWLLHRLLLIEGCELLLATGLTLLAAGVCSVHWLARPHLWSHLLTVVFLWQLRAFEAQRITAKVLIGRLAPLMVLWVNLHGAFFTGLVLIAIFCAGNCLNWRTTSRKAGVFALAFGTCLAASLLNPNGPRLHVHILEFLRTPVVAKMANEFQSPNFHSGGLTGFALQLLVLGLVIVGTRPQFSTADLFLIGVWGYFALQAVRNVPIFGLVIAPVLAEHLNVSLRNAADSRFIKIYRRISSNVADLDRFANGRVLIVLAVLAIVLLDTNPKFLGGSNILATEPLTNRFPAAAVEFLKKTPEVVHGKMFNKYAWGGYLMLALPEHKVFIDGRNDFYGPQLVEEFNIANEARPTWDKVLDKYKVDWTILPVDHALNQILELNPEWRRVYSDHTATIFSRSLEQP